MDNKLIKRTMKTINNHNKTLQTVIMTVCMCLSTASSYAQSGFNDNVEDVAPIDDWILPMIALGSMLMVIKVYRMHKKNTASL